MRLFCAMVFAFPALAAFNLPIFNPGEVWLSGVAPGAHVSIYSAEAGVLGDSGHDIGHLSNIVLEFSDAGSGNFFVIQVSSSIDSRVGSCWDRNVLVCRCSAQDLFAILDELLAKFFGKFIRLTSLGRAVINVILHEVKERRVRSVHDTDTLAHNLTINSL